MMLTGSRAGFSVLLVAVGFAVAPGCASDDDDTGSDPGAMCVGKGGPVEGPEDDHCIDDHGKAITQAIGKCDKDGGGSAGGGGAAGAGGQGDDGAEEPYEIRYLDHAADDDCKYDAKFTNTCIELNKPVTLRLSLRVRKTGNLGSSAHPDSPEIFLASDPSHISPSNSITATEGPLGEYAIGPIVFDRTGRWVVRFHYYEDCSDIPKDSPHGHVAFYVDVP